MFDIYGLGNAIVDVEVNIDDSFLSEQDIAKGHMTLVDSARMQTLITALKGQPMNRCSGGSAANTIFATQAFGLTSTYTCKVAADQSGDYFIEEMQAAGIKLNDNAQSPNGATGQCLVLISQDAERSMNTDLGISSELASTELHLDALRQSKYFYVEGYLSSSPSSAQAATICREEALANDTLVALSLSDPSMVEFFRDAMAGIMGNGVNIIFCNEEEAMAWANTDRLDIAITELRDIAPDLFVTVGAKGSIAVSKNGIAEVAGFETKAVDTTGAGDIYAGACLAAIAKGASPAEAAKFANYSAAQLVSRYGARLKSAAEYKKLTESYSI